MFSQHVARDASFCVECMRSSAKRGKARPRIAAHTLMAVACALLSFATTATASEIHVADSRLFVDGDSKTNVIDVRIIGSAYVIDDANSDMVAGAGCGNLNPRRVICGAVIQSVDVQAHDGNDLIGLWDVTVPARVDGGAGEDLIETGSARDELIGGDGADALVGAGGEDSLTGQKGDDLLEGGGGADTLTAGDGNDTLAGGNSTADVLDGGAGKDLLQAGTKGGGRLLGRDGDDVLVAHGGDNRLDPGAGSNLILGVNPASDSLQCTSKDRARTRKGRVVAGCSTVAPGVRVPIRWPPQPRAARAAVLPDMHPTISARPRVSGDATHFTVKVRSDHSGEKRVCIRFYDHAKRRVRRFTKTVRTRYGKTYSKPAIPSNSYYGRPYSGKCK
jgi:hypothetical protein